MAIRWMIVAVSTLAIAVPACAQIADSAPPLRKEMLVTTAWLAGHLNDADMVVLCVNSTPEFYSRSHIPGARQIKLGEIAVTRDGIPNELPPVAELRKLLAAEALATARAWCCTASARTCLLLAHTSRSTISAWPVARH